jgi:hypothetical protein
MRTGVARCLTPLLFLVSCSDDGVQVVDSGVVLDSDPGGDLLHADQAPDVGAVLSDGRPRDVACDRARPDKKIRPDRAHPPDTQPLTDLVPSLPDLMPPDMPRPDKGPPPDKGLPPDKSPPPDKALPPDKSPPPDKGLPPDKGVPLCGSVPCSCVLKGKKLWGSVYWTSAANLADFSVHESKVSGELWVYNASNPSLATSCGKWYTTWHPSLADLVLYKTSHWSLADFSYVRVQFPPAGMSCSSCP